jgi:hypothetical protein
MEFAFVMYLRGAVEETVRRVARLGLTGSTYDSTLTREQFLALELQNQLQGVVVFNRDQINNDINVTTRVYGRFFDVLSNSGTDTSGPTVSYGAANQIVEYKVRYNYQFVTPLARLAQQLGNTINIQTTVFAKNEDF